MKFLKTELEELQAGDQALKENLRQLQDAVREVIVQVQRLGRHWLRQEKLHITFSGLLTTESLMSPGSELESIRAAKSTARLTLRIGNTGYLWIGMKPAPISPLGDQRPLTGAAREVGDQ